MRHLRMIFFRFRIVNSLIAIMAVISCTKAIGDYEVPSKEQQKADKQRSEVVPISQEARDPIIEKYIQFTFGRRVNELNEWGYTPLMEAIIRRDANSALILLENPEVDLCVKNKFGNTALYLASAHGQSLIVHLLLEKGAIINSNNNTECSILHRAVANRHISVVQLLLEYGYNANATDKCRNTPLHIAVSSDNSEKMVKLLLANGADANIKNNLGKTALDIARERRHTATITLLEQAGAE